jgi:hypothetical protein
MAQYYADIQGNRGEATRMGTKNSGLSGHIRGWDVGARVTMRWNELKEEDEVSIELTGGSNGGRSVNLGTFTHRDVIIGE